MKSTGSYGQKIQSTGNLILVNEFSEKSAAEFKERIFCEAQENPYRPIVVYIDSYGGMVDSLATMIEAMEAVPNKIVTVALGKAISCGAILLSAGDLRFCGKHSRVMVHELSGGAIGNVNDVLSDAEQLRELNTYWMDFLAKNCKVKGGLKRLLSQLRKNDGRDFYLDAKAAVKFGIADYVGLPAIQEMMSYDIIVLNGDKENA